MIRYQLCRQATGTTQHDTTYNTDTTVGYWGDKADADKLAELLTDDCYTYWAHVSDDQNEYMGDYNLTDAINSI